MKIVQCIPNYSVSDQKSINAITSVFKDKDGFKLLSVEPDASYNRTVVTLLGEPEKISEAITNSVGICLEVIDMTKHSGEHKRMGALDVCPFVPVTGISMDECVSFAKKTGEDIAKKHNVSVFLYAEAAQKSNRKKLPTIRKGEYEAMAEKIQKPEWEPDYGPTKMNAKFGCCALGAREPLIAYNIDLDTDDVKVASKIAKRIRSTSGGFTNVQAGGIAMEKDGKTWTQVTMNILNYKKTAMYTVFETVKMEAKRYGVNVTGSEIIGVVPNDAVNRSIAYYLGLTNYSRDLFLETHISGNTAKKPSLTNMKTVQFINEVDSKSPAPGGGSVSALASSLGGALARMVTHLTVGKKKFKELDEKVQTKYKKAASDMLKLKERLVELIDLDTEAFNKIMAAFKLPKGTDVEIKAQKIAEEKATLEAIEVPFEIAKVSLDALTLIETILENGNKNAASDAGVGALLLQAGVRGAIMNVKINLPGLSNATMIKKFKDESAKIEKEAAKATDTIVEKVNKLIS